MCDRMTVIKFDAGTEGSCRADDDLPPSWNFFFELVAKPDCIANEFPKQHGRRGEKKLADR